MSSEIRSKIIKAIVIILTIYLFLLSIKLLGHSFKLFGKGFAESNDPDDDKPVLLVLNYWEIVGYQFNSRVLRPPPQLLSV